MAIFTILYGNYYLPHEEFKLICIGKFARRTWVNFTQQYGKNRQRCQQNKFYYAVWQLLLYYYREFPSKILSVCDKLVQRVILGVHGEKGVVEIVKFPCARSSERSCERKLKKYIFLLESFFFNQ